MEHLDAESRAAIAAATADGPVLLIKAVFDPLILRSAFNPASLLPTVDLVGSLLHVCSPFREQPTLDSFEPDRVYMDMVLVIRPQEGLPTIQKLFAGLRFSKLATRLAPSNLPPPRSAASSDSQAPPTSPPA